MTTLAVTAAIASLAIFAGWLALSIHKFGWLGSYSAYAAKWTEFLYIDSTTHAWGIVTMVVAFLLVYPMLAMGDESPLQFLGFFAPVYLGVVALTPEWETKRRQKIVHFVGTALCATATVLWLVLALRLWYYLAISFVVMWTAAWVTKTVKTSYVLWLELTLFAAVYAAILT